MANYLDILEISKSPFCVRTEISGIEVADFADAHAKLALYAPYFDGIDYEAFFHEHFHVAVGAEQNKPCIQTRIHLS